MAAVRFCCGFCNHPDGAGHGTGTQHGETRKVNFTFNDALPPHIQLAVKQAALDQELVPLPHLGFQLGGQPVPRNEGMHLTFILRRSRAVILVKPEGGTVATVSKGE